MTLFEWIVIAVLAIMEIYGMRWGARYVLKDSAEFNAAEIRRGKKAQGVGWFEFMIWLGIGVVGGIFISAVNTIRWVFTRSLISDKPEPLLQLIAGKERVSKVKKLEARNAELERQLGLNRE